MLQENYFSCNFSHGAGHIQGGKKKEEMEVYSAKVGQNNWFSTADIM